MYQHRPKPITITRADCPDALGMPERAYAAPQRGWMPRRWMHVAVLALAVALGPVAGPVWAEGPGGGSSEGRGEGRDAGRDAGRDGGRDRGADNKSDDGGNSGRGEGGQGDRSPDRDRPADSAEKGDPGGGRGDAGRPGADGAPDRARPSDANDKGPERGNGGDAPGRSAQGPDHVPDRPDSTDPRSDEQDASEASTSSAPGHDRSAPGRPGNGHGPGQGQAPGQGQEPGEPDPGAHEPDAASQGSQGRGPDEPADGGTSADATGATPGRPDDDEPGLIEAPEGAAMVSSRDMPETALAREGVAIGSTTGEEMDDDLNAALDAARDITSPQPDTMQDDPAAATGTRRAAPDGWGAPIPLLAPASGSQDDANARDPRPGTGSASPATLKGAQGRGRVSAAETPQGPAENPVVVELFTAQGCSNCPPADRMIMELAGRPDVLPLAWHVDYWDYLGWKDEFATPANTERQEDYARAVGEHGVYTPQIVVGGQDTLIAARPADLAAMILDHQARPDAVIVTSTDEGEQKVIQLTPRADIPGGVKVVLIRFAPLRKIEIKTGENRGRTATYGNVVLSSEELAQWDAHAPLRLRVTPQAGVAGRFPKDTRHAIVAQQIVPGKGDMPGPILAAVRLD